MEFNSFLGKFLSLFLGCIVLLVGINIIYILKSIPVENEFILTYSIDSGKFSLIPGYPSYEEQAGYLVVSVIGIIVIVATIIAIILNIQSDGQPITDVLTVIFGIFLVAFGIILIHIGITSPKLEFIWYIPFTEIRMPTAVIGIWCFIMGLPIVAILVKDFNEQK